MKYRPFISHDSQYSWEYLPGQEGREDVLRWKTLISGDVTPTEGLVMGICEVPAGVTLNLHRHLPQEIYYVTEGSGEVQVDSEIQNVEQGSVIYVPGNAVHGIRNNSSETLCLMWIFPADVWRDIEYHMVD